jgi:predicted transcriptional regulator
MARRFTSAWHRLENGQKVRETHLTFPDLPALLSALSPKRLELLQSVHHPFSR